MNARKRRAIINSGEEIDRQAVFEFHDWTCCICHGKIDPLLRSPHPDSATLEHIIPLSKGGRHVWENVAPAHSHCNAVKGCGLLLDTGWGQSVVWETDVSPKRDRG